LEWSTKGVRVRVGDGHTHQGMADRGSFLQRTAKLTDEQENAPAQLR
jgi:hypothetical protein